MKCDTDCDYSKFIKVKNDFFFIEKGLMYTFDEWYFYGDDFFFTDAENNFSFADKVINDYETLNYGLFSEYLQRIDESKELFEFS